MATGNWNIAGINLPELRISETLREFGSGLVGKTPDNSAYGSIYKSTYKPTSGTNTTSTSGAPAGTNFGSLYKPTANNGLDATRNYAVDLEKKRKADEDAARKKILSQTRKAYSPFFTDLARQEAEIPGIQNEYMGVMNQGFQNQVDTINRGQEAGLAQAESSRGEIKQNQATSLRDLASNLSNAVNAFGQRLGQVGAGDSSAANMANYAYSKLANRNTADVMGQVRSQLAKVEEAKINLVNDAKDKLSALDTWKANQTLSIQQYVRSLRDYVSKARAQGKQALAEDEVNMIREGFTRAQERLQQINDLAVTSRYQILQNAQSALADAQSFSDQLMAAGDTNPTPVAAPAVDSGSIGDASAQPMVPYGSTDTTEEKSLTDLLNAPSQDYLV